MPIITLTPQDKASLREAASRMDYAASAIRSAVEVLDREGLETIDVKNYRTFMRALTAIEAYAFAVRERVFEVKAERGDFVAAGAEPPSLARAKSRET